MPNLLELPSWDEQGRLRVVVETPQGTPFKVHYDAATLAFTYQRPLHHQRYPYDWGFVPGTLADDGDPLDALVLHYDATWPGVILPSEPLAILKIRDKKPGADRELENDRIIAVLSDQPPAARVALSAQTRRELEDFFQTAGAQSGKKLRVLGWGTADEARAAIQHAKRR